VTPYSGRLPLRTTSAWESFREAVAIPHRYGETSGDLIQYEAGRRVWVWADHASLSVDEILIDGQPVTNWVWRNTTDTAGHAVTVVEFDAGIDEGTTPVASGRGKLNANTGALIVNPADVVQDILANIAGRAVTAGQIELFRRECERAGIVVAGSLTSADVTVQAAVREVCDSIAAVFAPDAPGLAILHPGGDTPIPLVTIDRRYPDLGATANVAELVNDLTLRFDFANGEPRQSVQLDCPGAVAAQGRRSDTRDARPGWRASIAGVRRTLALGDGLSLDHARLPIAGTFRVMGRSVDLVTGISAVEFDVPAGPVPAVRMVRQSTQLEPEQYANVGILTQGDSRIINLIDEDGRPISQGAVTLNGETTRYTDSAGNVSFPVDLMPPGQHTLTILTSDGRTLTTTVTV